MIIRPKIPVEAKLLKQTTSRCPDCGAEAPAYVYERSAQVFLRRFCRAHGERTALLSSDSRFYHLSLGPSSCGSSCACHSAPSKNPSHSPSPASAAFTSAPHSALSPFSPSSSPDPFDILSTCLALIEIVDSCNLACPTCYADSPHTSRVSAISFDDFRSRVDGVVARKGKIDILQLSGGEPTLHPQFFDLLEWAQNHDGIGYVLINTNGLRLASDAAFVAEMDARYRRGRVQLYLQFDGPGAEGQVELRGADLRATRRRALENCAAFAGGGLPITLAMTVTPENRNQLWDAVEFGLQFPHVRGVAFQPMFGSGRTHLAAPPLRVPVLQPAQIEEAANVGRDYIPTRTPSAVQGQSFWGARHSASERGGEIKPRVERRGTRGHDSPSPEPPNGGGGSNPQQHHRRLNTADIILGLVDQSAGKLKPADFTPLPCGDPNCATIGYLLKLPSGEARSISDFVDFSQIQDFLADRLNYTLEDLAHCGCEAEPLGDLLKRLELDPSRTFRLFIKPFMDAWSWDQDRIDRCCTHVIRPDGKLDSFCRYYSGFPGTKGD